MIPPIKLTKPGLFITATDTEIGKTVATCAIAHAIRKEGLTVGVCKPIASGCRSDRGQLISPDTEALAHFADSNHPLTIINPITYKLPLAPAAAADLEKTPVDFQRIADALHHLDQSSDIILIEGIGGLLVPLTNTLTLAHLAQAIAYPVAVVTRQNLGTLNHTALTTNAIQSHNLKLAGLILNRYNPDPTDTAEQTNPHYLTQQNKTKILAHLPDTPNTSPEKGQIPLDILHAASLPNWQNICKPPNHKKKKN